MQKTLSNLQNGSVTVLTVDKLNELLEATETLFEKDTLISGLIRILGWKDLFIVQEISNKNELVLHSFETYEAAKALVQDHLKTYDMMWDGCGCKIDYYS